jgi:transposase-like protein
MDTRSLTTEYRLGQWAQILKERSMSGQSIRAYCKEAGIAECVYYYWQKKLREAASREIASHRTDNPATSKAPKGGALCASAETYPVGHASVSTTVRIEIGQYRIGVEAGADAETLSMVLRVIGSQC